METESYSKEKPLTLNSDVATIFCKERIEKKLLYSTAIW